MFLKRLLETNRALAETALGWQRDGTLLPDTYVIDLDAVLENAEAMLAEANRCDVRLYFMLKQLGRNPLVAQRLSELGFSGAVCVDAREALVMADAGVPLGNVGHLVQTPVSALGRVLAARPDIMTVYSIEKAAQIGDEAERQGFVQDVMVRVIGEGDLLYPGQYGGFPLVGLERALDELDRVTGVRVAGACSFPCLLFSKEKGDVVALPNANTVCAAAELLRARGCERVEVNMPSASCCRTIPLVAELGGTHAEPGHGLTGTTPYHSACADARERCGYVYVSEVSHDLGGHAFCYGGGHYRRGHVGRALVGATLDSAREVAVTPPSDESIDYHFGLSEPARVGDGVLMCFRTQMFVTRSEVAVASGISSGTPRLEGVFDAQGRRLR